MHDVLIYATLVILAVLAAYLLNTYSFRGNVPWYALLTTWLGWSLSFSVVVMLPLDLVLCCGRGVRPAGEASGMDHITALMNEMSISPNNRAWNPL